MSEATCVVVRVVPDDYGQGHEMPPCGKPRRRRTCCDECFEKLIASGDFTREEAEREYPIDWPAFWRSLPPREQWEAAKAMPKIAGPWTDEDCRLTPDGRHVAWVIRNYVESGAEDAPVFPDRASADAALRAADWILVDEETSR